MGMNAIFQAERLPVNKLDINSIRLEQSRELAFMKPVADEIFGSHDSSPSLISSED